MSLAKFSEAAAAVTYTPTWPEDRVARLLHLWNVEKWSAGKIADQFGITRNAVIGKVGRLGDIMETRGRVLGPEKKIIRQRQRGGGNTLLHRAKRVARQAMAAEVYEEPTDFEVPVEQRKTFFQLGPNDCRWPSLKINVGHPDFYFCGGKIDDSHQSYCASHAGLSYRCRR